MLCVHSRLHVSPLNFWAEQHTDVKKAQHMLSDIPRNGNTSAKKHLQADQCFWKVVISGLRQRTWQLESQHGKDEPVLGPVHQGSETPAEIDRDEVIACKQGL